MTSKTRPRRTLARRSRREVGLRELGVRRWRQDLASPLSIVAGMAVAISWMGNGCTQDVVAVDCSSSGTGCFEVTGTTAVATVTFASHTVTTGIATDASSSFAITTGSTSASGTSSSNGGGGGAGGTGGAGGSGG